MEQETLTWDERAIQYLRKNTSAKQDVMERFVELFWDQDATEEDNLMAFQYYENELQTAYSD